MFSKIGTFIGSLFTVATSTVALPPPSTTPVTIQEKIVVVTSTVERVTDNPKLQAQIKVLQAENDTLKKQIASLTKDNASIQSNIKLLTSKSSEAINALQERNTKLKGNYDELYGLANQCVTALKEQVNRTTNIPTVPTYSAPTPAPVKPANYKCFTSGTSVECFDLNTFPSELTNTLNSIASQAIPSPLIEGQQLRAIKNYFGN